jgi:hypothetical protein
VGGAIGGAVGAVVGGAIGTLRMAEVLADVMLVMLADVCNLQVPSSRPTFVATFLRCVLLSRHRSNSKIERNKQSISDVFSFDVPSRWLIALYNSNPCRHVE